MYLLSILVLFSSTLIKTSLSQDTLSLIFYFLKTGQKFWSEAILINTNIDYKIRKLSLKIRYILKYIYNCISLISIFLL